MLQNRSILIISDNSGIRLSCCIQIISKINKNLGYFGDILVMSVKKIFKENKRLKLKKKNRKKMYKGEIFRGMIIRCNSYYLRQFGFFFKFFDNSCILTNKKGIPLYSRVKGPVIAELLLRFKFLSSVIQYKI